MSLQGDLKDGSSLYYSLLWVNDQARERFVNRLTLINALASTLDDVQEPQVAEKKIHWWHEELQRMNDGQARHPAAKSCQDNLNGLDKAQAVCLEILSVASSQRFSPATTIEAHKLATLQSYTARLALLAHALSNDEADLATSTHTAEAALAFGHYDQLSKLPTLVHRGLPVFSDELYRQFKVQPNDMAARIRVATVEADTDTSSLKGIPVIAENTTEKPSVQPLIDHAIDVARAAFDEAVQHPQTGKRYREPALRPLWRLLILRQQQLKLWQKKRPDLLRERLTLTPLVKLYYCWRNKC